MDSNPSYTFEWQVDGKVIGRSTCVRSELWQRFNEAADWARASVHRSASFFGPGIMKVLVGEYSRQRLRDILEPLGLVPIQPEYIGLLWARLTGGHFRLDKIRRETEELVGYERPHAIEYHLDPVDPKQVPGAFEWARERFWKPWGVWLYNSPALVFAVDFKRCSLAMHDIRECVLGLFQGELVRAPIVYKWDGGDDLPYPYIKPTRDVSAIHRLRRQYPTATDVKWTPSHILVTRHRTQTIVPRLEPAST